jgi:two-component system OmpR family response regulator
LAEARVSRPRVLVVDDEPEMRAMLDTVLRRAGLDVELAADGQVALEAALARPPALVITDIVMPRLDGWQLCRRLRAEPATAAVPVVFLSARNRAPDRIYGLQLGADDYLPKPFDTRELVARIRAVLKRAGGALRAASADETGIAGNLRDMSLVDIAQILDLGRKTATVRVTAAAGAGDEAVSGTLWFEQGQLVHAVYGATTGTAAFSALLGRSDGRFEIVPGASAPARSLRGSTQELLLTTIKRQDEARAGRAGAAPETPTRPAAAPAAADGSARRGATEPRTSLEPTLLDLFELGVIEPKG